MHMPDFLMIMVAVTALGLLIRLIERKYRFSNESDLERANRIIREAYRKRVGRSGVELTLITDKEAQEQVSKTFCAENDYHK